MACLSFGLKPALLRDSIGTHGRMPKHSEESLRELVKKLRTERDNFKSMYENAKQEKTIKALRARIAKLEGELGLRDEAIVLLREQNETLRLRVDELERMAFGKHKRKDKDPPAGGSGTGGAHVTDAETPPDVPAPEKRPPFSYRRKAPEERDVTETISHALPACPDCSGDLTKRKTVERFTEDMPSLGEIQKLLRRIAKHSIETGYCPCCQKRKTAIPIAEQTVSL